MIRVTSTHAVRLRWGPPEPPQLAALTTAEEPKVLDSKLEAAKSACNTPVCLEKTGASSITHHNEQHASEDLEKYPQEEVQPAHKVSGGARQEGVIALQPGAQKM